MCFSVLALLPLPSHSETFPIQATCLTNLSFILNPGFLALRIRFFRPSGLILRLANVSYDRRHLRCFFFSPAYISESRPTSVTNAGVLGCELRNQVIRTWSILLNCDVSSLQTDIFRSDRGYGIFGTSCQWYLVFYGGNSHHICPELVLASFMSIMAVYYCQFRAIYHDIPNIASDDFWIGFLTSRIQAHPVYNDDVEHFLISQERLETYFFLRVHEILLHKSLGTRYQGFENHLYAEPVTWNAVSICWWRYYDVQGPVCLSDVLIKAWIGQSGTRPSGSMSRKKNGSHMHISYISRTSD